MNFRIYDPLEVKSLLRKKNSILASLRKKKLKNKFKIAILGGSSTEDIKLFLEIFLLMRDIKVDFYESDFNSYYEEAVFGEGELYSFKPDIVFIHTTLRNIKIPPIKSNNECDKLKNEILHKFETIWSHIQERLNCTIIQNNIDVRTGCSVRRVAPAEPWCRPARSTRRPSIHTYIHTYIYI